MTLRSTGSQTPGPPARLYGENNANNFGASVYLDSKSANAAEALQKMGGAQVILATAPSSKCRDGSGSRNQPINRSAPYVAGHARSPMCDAGRRSHSETFQHDLAASAALLDQGVRLLQMIRIDAGNSAGHGGDQRAVIHQCRYAA
jgi:hypothetical protein